MNSKSIVLAQDDDVAVVVEGVDAGVEVAGVTALDAVPPGHKIAVHPIGAGEMIHKYGQVIGVATADIVPGAHVHSHNLTVSDTRGGRTQARSGGPLRAPSGVTFDGYSRPDGRTGTRNFIGVLTSVNCSATVARQIARRMELVDAPGIDGVAAFTHSTGCGMAKDGEGMEVLERTLAGYATHPNFGGVLLIGLGCEMAQIGDLLDHFGLSAGPRLRTLTIQDAGGTAAAIAQGEAMVRELIEEAQADRRRPLSVAELVLGLQCGGSDAWSGVTANPALGIAADLLVAEGGTAILSETPEISGAEHLLLRRAVRPEVADALNARLAWWADYAAKNGASLDNNPSPGNKAGGLTTIYEKSLGAVAKAGSSPLVDVRRYAEPSPERGLIFMDSPGYDPCSATGQIAAGANILAFTTGRGSAFGSKPSPCIKIASNAELARRMSDDIDVDCSGILDGQTVEEAGRVIFDTLVATASGKPTRSEALGLGEHEFVPWQIGAWM